MRFFRKKNQPKQKGNAITTRRLHVGCGTEAIPGWCNIDIQDLPGVDLVMDVTQGFEFSEIEYIYCEHFIEHLRFDHGFRFLSSCFEALSDGGVMRLSTPNLDWVYLTHYSVDGGKAEDKINNTFMLNRAFYAWGHQFLYSREVLSEVLRSVGFSEISEHEYGASDIPELRGLERHERYGATPDLPDVLVIEAVRRGSGKRRKSSSAAILEKARSEFLNMLDWNIE